MKNKSLAKALLPLLALALTLSACGASTKPADDAGSVTTETNSMTQEDIDSFASSEEYGTDDYDEEWEYTPEAPAEESGETVSEYSSADASVAAYSSSDKIIYTADAEIETMEFDDSVAAVYEMADRYGGFIESSSMSGNRYYSEYYYGSAQLRYASFTVRVPVESYKTASDNLDSLGNVISISSYAENVTVQYTDIESRLASLRIEQDRLNELLEKAETVTDMIEIESRASEVRYEIESYESTLRNLQNRISYSTININLSEVERLTKVEEPNRTYWQKISDGMANTVDDIGAFFQDAFMDIAIALPLIAIWVVVIAAVVIVIITISKRRKRKKASAAPQIGDKSGDAE